MREYTLKGAVISPDQKYRYRLWRNWDRQDAQEGSCAFIMLNPSTADGAIDDPTIRRCVNFADRFGFGILDVVNLFAYRATDPKALYDMTHDQDPVGVDNHGHVKNVLARAKLIICAWGAHGGYLDQDETMLGWLLGHETYALGVTKDGFPRHPLYMSGAAKPVRYNGR